MKRCAWLLAGFLAGCAPSPPDEPRASRAPLVNGTLDSGHESVGVLFTGDTKSGCTGTLIAADRVLTAAHCLYGPPPLSPLNQSIYFFLGDEDRLHLPVRGAAVHPSYNGVREGDLAVLFLARPVPNVTPAPLSTTAPTRGDPITLVGYGITSVSAEDFGDKRSASQRVDEVGDQWFSFDCGGGSKPCTCQGDSGGPTFVGAAASDRVSGVHSGSSQDCMGFGYDMRVDRFAPWITAAQVEIGFYGAPCTTNSDCASALCVPVAGGVSYCSIPCSSAEPCPFLDQCQGTPQRCEPHTGGDGTLGAACDWGLDCLSGHCLTLLPPLQGSICSQVCDRLAQDCPDHFECRETDGAPLCVPTGNVTLPRDSGPSNVDASEPNRDGGPADAAPPASDGGTTSGEKSGGCRIDSFASPWSLWALLLLTFWRRRR